MVTGSDNLDSYEALWELAELLGQVKPPTATREEIDKSGLQIVKASDLPALEKEGRVASNCVDRVRRAFFISSPFANVTASVLCAWTTTSQTVTSVS